MPSPATAPLVFHGRFDHQLRNLADMLAVTAAVTARRLRRGPQRPGWSWMLETSTAFLRAQMGAAFDLGQRTGDMALSRAYADALSFGSPAAAAVAVTPAAGPVRGEWYTPPAARDRTVLYLHGGGFAYFAKAHAGLIAAVALAARARVFALDYRLIPEHPYPAQLEDALAAYRWLLAEGAAPARLAVAGDSAGGNLTLALLQALRRDGLPQPALAYAVCPWTDLANSGASLQTNAADDWVPPRLPAAWARQYCAGGADPRDPLVSPLHADLRGLAPIYVQAGGAEILLDMIQAMCERAAAQGAEVSLDVWPHMPHDFQAYGELLPEARQALECFRAKLDERLAAAEAAGR